MNIFFRVDSSNIIGTGHIIRCLKLAKYFNHNIFLFVRNFKVI
jgi:spore coat polysaccharide biosynthesis predicted glycosyltransferase SpsG